MRGWIGVKSKMWVKLVCNGSKRKWGDYMAMDTTGGCGKFWEFRKCFIQIPSAWKRRRVSVNLKCICFIYLKIVFLRETFSHCSVSKKVNVNKHWDLSTCIMMTFTLSLSFSFHDSVLHGWKGKDVQRSNPISGRDWRSDSMTVEFFRSRIVSPFLFIPSWILTHSSVPCTTLLNILQLLSLAHELATNWKTMDRWDITLWIQVTNFLSRPSIRQFQY